MLHCRFLHRVPHTYISSCYDLQESSNPIFFTLILLELSPRIPVQSLLQFEIFYVPHDVLLTASLDSIEGCTEEETEQYTRVSVCTCVKVYLCAHVCDCVFVYVSVCMHARACVDVCECLCMYVFVHVCVCVF